jgi:hypothetical protein
VAPEFSTRRRTAEYEAVNATGVPFNEFDNAINTRSFKRSVRAEQGIFLMTIPKNLSGLDLRPGWAMGLHQHGVITVVRSRRSGAINTGYVH